MPSLSTYAFRVDELLADLQEKGVKWLNKIEYFPSIESSNSYLLNLNASHGRVCIADYQTHGRGRRGKQWQSRPGESLMFSMGWTPKKNHFGELSLVIGLAIAEVLKQLGVKKVALKWPNDVMVDNAKLAGILVESRTKGSSVEMVIGVGINFNVGQAALTAIHAPLIDIKRLGLHSISRKQLFVMILESISARLVEYESSGFQNLRAKWLNYSADIGCEVRFQHNSENLEGRIIGLDAQGSLLIEHSGELMTVNSGEVHTLRRRV